MKVVRLSALGTGRLYPVENIPATHFCYRQKLRRLIPVMLSQNSRTTNFWHIFFYTFRQYNKTLIDWSIVFFLAAENISLKNLSPKR